MKTGRAELKERARKSLKGHYPLLIGTFILFFFICWLFRASLEAGTAMFGISLIPGSGHAVRLLRRGQILIIPIALICLSVYLLYRVFISLAVPGLLHIISDISEGSESRFREIIWALSNKPWKFILITLAVEIIRIIALVPVIALVAAMTVTEEIMFPILFICFYMILIEIVLLYVNLTYGMFYFVLIDDPSRGIIEALTLSADIMRGNRLRYLVLRLSFIGWDIMSALSFNIGSLWIRPYRMGTIFEFYHDIRQQILQNS